MKRRSSRPTLDTNRSSSYSWFPFLHSIHVFSIFFSFVFIFFCSSCHHFTNNPPPFITSASSGPPYLPIPPSSVSQVLDSLPSTLLCQPSITKHGLCFPRCTNYPFSMLLILSGDISLNPGPLMTHSSLLFSLLNIRSASSITPQLNKPAALLDLIADKNIDILFLTETWLPPDTLPSVLNSLTPPDYSLINSPRLQGKGGGIAILFRSHLKIETISLPLFSSFEVLGARLTIASTSYIFLTVYRPPSSSKTLFSSEFTTLLETFISSPSEIIITGDFNFYVDDPQWPSATYFLDLLDAFGLSQLVSFPTHDSGHTLDLLITRTASTIFSDITFTCPSLSDHYAVLSSLAVPSYSRSPRITKLIRNIKKINTSLFSSDILSSSLFSSPAPTLSGYLLQFSSILSNLLDKHAPLGPSLALPVLANLSLLLTF